MTTNSIRNLNETWSETFGNKRWESTATLPNLSLLIKVSDQWENVFSERKLILHTMPDKSWKIYFLEIVIINCDIREGREELH